MKRMSFYFIFSFLCIIILVPFVASQNNWTWGTHDDDSGTSIWIQGDYLYTVGYSVVNGTNDDSSILKWDLSGNLIWNQTWSGSATESFNSIYGHMEYLYTCGSTTSYGSGEEDLLLVKWDENGNQIWNRTWGMSISEIGFEIWGINSSIYTSGEIDGDIFLVKWDLNGNQIWNKTWGSPDIDHFNGGLCGDDKAIYVAYSKGHWKNADIVLQGWTHNGSLLWTDTYATVESDHIYDAWSDQNTIFIVGDTGGSSLKQDIIIIAWSKNGTKLWDTTWDLNDYDIGTGIWGDNDSLYISGYSLDWSGSSFGGKVSVVLRYTLDGVFDTAYAITSIQFASDIVGQDDSLFILGHKDGGNIDIDINVYELTKNFETNFPTIPGFPFILITIASISAILVIVRKIKTQQTP